MFGDFLDKDGRYARCDEFLTIVRAALDRRDRRPSRASTCRVEDAVLSQIPDPLPEIYFGGSSPAAGRVAAKHVDVYLTWGEPPAAVRREGRVDPQARRRRGSRGPDPLRHPAAHDRPRHLRGGLGRGRPAARRHLRGGDRPGAGRPASRASPSARRRMLELNARLQGRPGDPPQPLGRRRPGPRRRRHRDGRQPRRDRRPDRAVRRRSASTSSCSPATRTSRSPTGSARACCPSWPGAACGSTRRPSAVDAAVRAVRRRRRRPRRDRRRVRRRRQPQAAEPHARGRDVRRHRARRASPTWSSTWPTSAPGCSTGRTRSSPSWSTEVGAADLVVVASPTYKGTYTGLLKLFLDRFADRPGSAASPSR